MPNISERTKNLKQSGIRNASVQCARLGGVNLGQGICDLPIMETIKQEAYEAIGADKNIYSACQGVHQLRDALAKKIQHFNHIDINPDTELMVSHGATGAFVCAVMTVFNPGDEVILFEPFYGYHKHILEVNNIGVKAVPINLDDFSIDIDQLRQAIGKNTKGIVICTPNNPSGKIYSKEELLAIGKLADEFDLTIITDEIYEYFVYPGYQHVSLASLEHYKNRTLTISGFSKTYNMTGWRLGYISGPAPIIEKMSILQDLLYVCPNTPLQYALIKGLEADDDYYQGLRYEFLAKRDHIVAHLMELGFKLSIPQGAYYLIADITELGYKNGDEAAQRLLNDAKVAVVPGSSFYLNPSDGDSVVRICFALREEILNKAIEQMRGTRVQD